MLQSRGCLDENLGVVPAAMDELFILVLKYALLLVMAGAAIAIFREIVPMARGKAVPHSEPTNNGEE